MAVRVVDADTHVDECEATWEQLDTSERKFGPITVLPTPEARSTPNVNVGRGRWWLVDGQLIPRAIRGERNHPSAGARELHDVQARLQDMDRMGVEKQIIFPTFFIRYGNTTNPRAELAVTRSYNRWIAERCSSAEGRLRWVAQLPLLDVEKAVQELSWAKDHGACGFYKRGYDLGVGVDDPHFFPVYEAAASLDIPVCIHTGHPLPGREWDRSFPIISAFMAVVSAHLPEKFPTLRFGFIEAGASWVSYTLSQLRMRQRSERLQERAQTLEDMSDLFRVNRLFIAIDPVDDIEYLVDVGAEDNLMIGTDYGHSDVSANAAALEEVLGWVKQGKISESIAKKVLETNPRKFYGVS